MFDKITNVLLVLICAYVAWQVKGIVDNQPKPQKNEPKKVEVKVNPHWHTKGKGSKEVIIVSDYECPFCSKLLDSEFYKIVDKASDEGKIKLSVADFPLAMHKNAKKAAILASCSPVGTFWQVDSRLHGEFQKLDTEVDFPCRSDNKWLDEEIEGWKRLGVQGTPSIVVGRENEGVVSGLMTMGSPTVDIKRWVEIN